MLYKKPRLILSLLLLYTTGTQAQLQLSDAPDSMPVSTKNNPYPSYETALQHWKTIAEINNWIQDHFRYSLTRAKQLAANSTTRNQVAIYTPAILYTQQTGVCIDVSRFAVETIRAIDSTIQVQYLLIEFEPVTIDGSTLKNHWLAVYRNEKGYYMLADSKRPGYMAGPYNDVADFITEYSVFRNRKVVSWKMLPSYQKTKKQLQQATARQQN